MIDISSKKLRCNNEIIRLYKDVTIEELCDKYDIKKEQLITIKHFYKKGDIIFIKYPDCLFHIVMPGETLDLIATQYNVAIDKIIEKNHSKRIFIGQILFI